MLEMGEYVLYCSKVSHFYPAISILGIRLSNLYGYGVPQEGYNFNLWDLNTDRMPFCPPNFFPSCYWFMKPSDPEDLNYWVNAGIWRTSLDTWRIHGR